MFNLFFYISFCGNGWIWKIFGTIAWPEYYKHFTYIQYYDFSLKSKTFYIIWTFRMYFEYLFAFADEVLEQADYLYSCAEIEKLHQLLLQYKDRWGRDDPFSYFVLPATFGRETSCSDLFMF